MRLELSEKRVGIALDDAKDLIAEYCFEEARTPPRPPLREYGPPLSSWQRPRWGYRSYDCQKGLREGIDIVDMVAPALLNVTHGFGVELVSDLLAIAPVVNETVARVPSHVRFWTLRDEEIAHPAEGSPSWLLHRAWYLIESVPHCGLTNTHKILHHAWPHLFPLIDTRTAPYLGDHMWLTIHGDLDRHQVEFEELETWFASLAGDTRRGSPDAPTPLRHPPVAKPAFRHLVP